jgi:adenylate cyclase
MAGALQIRIDDGTNPVVTEEFDGPVVLGRQSDGDAGLYARRQDAGLWRLVVAGPGEPSVAASQVMVAADEADGVFLENTGGTASLRLSDGSELAPASAARFERPVTLTFGQTAVEVSRAENGTGSFRRLDAATPTPGKFEPTGDTATRLPCLESVEEVGDAAIEALLRTLHPVVMVLQSANRSADFFHTAARAVVEALGMDTGCVLLRRNSHWRSASHHEARVPPGGPLHDHLPAHSLTHDHDRDNGRREECWRRSRRLLDRLVGERRTLWSDADPEDVARHDGPPHDGPVAVVVAPILNRDRDVIGAVYGERHPVSRADCPRIRRVDALLLEMLAGSLASGLSRIELEKAAVSSRVRFEQFFSPELADELAARPDLLTARQVEVTMLFADIRGFSRVSERVGPARSLEWVGGVLGDLSDCVLAHGGVLVDYIGDELIAMWGAPKTAPDHASQACRAALDMIDRLPALNAKWEPLLGEKTDLGIGVNTGPAQVGNTGTTRKFKYGALGNTVNLASRVQGSTKYLKTRLVVTGATRSLLGPDFVARRLGKATVVNIAEPVELHEVVSPGQPRWDDVCGEYEQALDRFEARDFAGSVRALGALLAKVPDDGPSLLLMTRAVDAVVSDPSAFNPVWKLPGK